MVNLIRIIGEGWVWMLIGPETRGNHTLTGMTDHPLRVSIISRAVMILVAR